MISQKNSISNKSKHIHIPNNALQYERALNEKNG